MPYIVPSNNNAAPAEPFPVRVFNKINECAEHDPQVASWSEDGLRFVVKNKVTLLERYFTNYNKYESFVRQLNNYRFSRSTTKDGREIWYHKNFCKDRGDLVAYIKAEKSGKRKRSESYTDMKEQNHRLRMNIECLKVVKKLKSLGYPISKPVDPISLDGLHNSQMITNRMDLDTIENRLMNDYYYKLEVFKADVYLTLDNAMRCYKEDSFKWKVAKMLKDDFTSDYENLAFQLDMIQPVEIENDEERDICHLLPLVGEVDMMMAQKLENRFS
uniref:Bromo domain-containing protein n=1 Tax=Ditylum brightwellii TaxID=49249 RepID=A0A7S2A2Y0_9STRA|mmetsp:Transcript_7641/g.11399  ORF Transcript_7641/g.11399 Transcript_7641/m.11399 type:complete len:273 (+) Transcript_7641:47-865(+)